MNKLSIPSRVILALASLSLIVTFFVPFWRIDLFAPQYPEGLVMKIWLHTLTGDVEIINGLNHYIGMRHINVAMFPEFEFLRYVVAFYILLGLAVAVIGNRKVLFWYLVFTAFGAIFAAYDFYRWGYEYGHNLDPAAPIKVPGLSYQPPMVGHKRLLNFDAYSFPEIGGWIIIGAAGIFALVWFLEIRRSRRVKKAKGGILASLLISIFAFVSCSSGPEPFMYGTDVCHTCKMGIADHKFGSQLVTTKGKVYKFDDVGCMVQYLKSGGLEQEDLKHTVVINYLKKDDFLDVESAIFAVSDSIRSPMNFHVAAFATKNEAQGIFSNAQFFSWEELYKKVE